MNKPVPWRATLILILIAALPWSAVVAQTTTATLRGKITNEQGNPVASAEVNAVNAASGFVHTVTARPDGSYQLGGLTPGTYNLVIAAQGYEPKSQDVTVLVGQTVDLNVRIAPTAVLTESITVVGTQVVDTRATEVATNVTQEQIQNLPQNDRNFLNFANMAPGVTMSNNPERKVISSGGQAAEQTNLFIDGVSQKNDVLQGGMAGQDASRGNPFPQNAVQEFRVITQNYSAQYDKASAAIITAITRSGSNTMDGEAFWHYQPKSFVSELHPDRNLGYQFNTLTANPDYRRNQFGLSLGGPIIRDRLHYFGSFERNDEHATRSVALGNPAFANQFGQYVGTFAAPFESNLGFAKLSWQPATGQLLDFSGSYRREKDIRDFGGQTSFESATNIKNWVYGLNARHQWNNNNALNQLSLAWSDYGWNPEQTTQGVVGKNYFGVIRIGGNSTFQEFRQKRIELRDDYNFAGFEWHGAHNLQAGGNADFLDYDITKSLNGNPIYNFNIDAKNGLSFDFPFEAFFGIGNPSMSASNKEYGLYVQDNWTPTQRLNLSLGLRWDYESNMLDNEYVTPPNIVTAVKGAQSAWLNPVPESYFSTGSNRKPYKNAIQPRLGFSYDLTGQSKSVVFGGWGRYYDRIFLNAGLDERYRLQYPTYQFRFSATGEPRDGNPTVKWKPEYLTPAGLQTLIANGSVRPEIFMNDNDTVPPYADQANLGYRHTFGTVTGSISYNVVRGYHGFTHRWGNLNANRQCCAPSPQGYGNVLLSDDTIRRWFDGIYLTLDRPFTRDSRWGAHLAWTHGDSKQTGNDLFSLDYPTPSDFPKHTVPGTQKDRIVATGMLGLPFEFLASAIVTLGSGAATEMHDFSRGFGPGQGRPFGGTVYPPKENGFAERNLDLRLTKPITLGPTRVELIGEVFNAFNTPVYGCLTNFLPPEGNPNLGRPNCVTNIGRRFQAGVRVGF